MNYALTSNSSTKPISSFKLSWLAMLLLSAAVLLLTGCFSSTKMYNTQKTVVYKDSTYNVSQVKVISLRTEGIISPTQTINLSNTDKKGFNELLDEHDSLMVHQVIVMDDQELTYQAKNVSSWREFDKMKKQFSSAGKSLNKFLAKKKATQLKLK